MADPAKENRLKNFASFFKGYMSAMPLVTAALAPILTLMKAIPVFETQKTSLATFSGLFGFLLVAWVFSVRSVIVPVMTNRFDPSGTKPLRSLAPIPRFVAWVGRYGFRTMATIMPLLLILLSAGCYVSYIGALNNAIYEIQHTQEQQINGSTKREEVLRVAGDADPIPHSFMLQATYLGIFLSAELAFVLMALREYGYSTLDIKEQEIMSGAWAKSTIHREP